MISAGIVFTDPTSSTSDPGHQMRADRSDRFFEAVDRRREDDDRTTRSGREAGEHDVGHLGEDPKRQRGIIGAQHEMLPEVLSHQAPERAKADDADERLGMGIAVV